MANNDPNQQRSEENRRFVAEILRQTANQYGRHGQRINNRVWSYLANTVMRSTGLGQAASRANIGQIPKVSTYDTQVDQIAKNFRLPGAEDAIRSSGARAPRGMALSEATTRAFIKAGEESGLTLEEIKKLLEESRSGQEQTDASGNITLERLTKDAHDLYVKMAELFTVPDLAGKFGQIGAEQTKTARKERAREEYNNRPIPKPDIDVFQPTAFMNKMLDAANEVFGGKQAQRRFEYEATDIHGETVRGAREGRSRNDILEWLRTERLRPKSITDSGASEKQSESPLSRFMTSFADYMGIAQLTEAEQNAAEENLTEAIDKLIDATNKNTDARNPKKPGKIRTAFQSASRWLKAKSIRGAIRGAKMMAKIAKPFARVAQKIIPVGMRQTAQKLGANILGHGAAKMGASPATAARLGAALGAAAGPIGAIILVVLALKNLKKYLDELAKQAWKTTLSLADHNGQLALANARLELNRTMRRFDMAAAIAPGGDKRIQAEDRLEAAMAPLNTALTDIGNWWGTITRNASAKVMEVLNGFMATMEDFTAWVHDMIPDNIDNDSENTIHRVNAARLRGQNIPGQNNQMRWAGIDHNGVDAQDAAARARGPRPPGVAVR